MSHHLGQTQGVKEDFSTSQTDTILVNCPPGRRIYIWHITANVGSGSNAVLSFNSSPTQEIITFENGDSAGVSCLNKLGDIGADIIISCPANTTIRMLFTLE